MKIECAGVGIAFADKVRAKHTSNDYMQAVIKLISHFSPT